MGKRMSKGDVNTTILLAKFMKETGRGVGTEDVCELLGLKKGGAGVRIRRLVERNVLQKQWKLWVAGPAMPRLMKKWGLAGAPKLALEEVHKEKRVNRKAGE